MFGPRSASSPRPEEASARRSGHAQTEPLRQKRPTPRPPAGASPCRSVPCGERPFLQKHPRLPAALPEKTPGSPLCRKTGMPPHSAGKCLCRGHALPRAGGSVPGTGRWKTQRPPGGPFPRPPVRQRGRQASPLFSGGMSLRAFRLQRRRIIRTPGPWRTRSGRCCGGCRRHFPKADSRRQSADRPWGNASALRDLRSCRSCRTHWSTASCRR